MIKITTNTKLSIKNQAQAEKALATLLQKKHLGFWQLPHREEDWRRAKAFATKIKEKKLVVIGMGGSALGGRCLVQVLASQAEVIFLNNTEAHTVQKILTDKKLLKAAHFLVISKSGGTLEIACLLDILLQELKKIKRDFRRAISVISEDENNPLTNWAKQQNINFLPHPKDVGGRFSAFTAVGLVPASYAGIKIENIRKGAIRALQEKDLLISLAAFYLDGFARGEFVNYFWPYIDQLSAFSDWAIQVWSESLAKAKSLDGQVGPMVGTPVFCFGARDQHSVLQQMIEGQNKISICFYRLKDKNKKNLRLTGKTLEGFEYIRGKNLSSIFMTQSVATEEALQKVGRSTCAIELEKFDAMGLGYLMMMHEMLIGILGECLNINAFDQPGVEIGKKITIEKLKA